MNRSRESIAKDSIRRDAAVALVRGVPVATAILVLAVVMGGISELRQHPERTWPWLTSAAVQFALCGFAVWVRRRVHNPLAGRVLTVLIVLVLAGSMIAYTAVVRGDGVLLAIWLILLLTGVSLMIPLGKVGQAVVAIGVTAGYASVLGMSPLSSMSPVLALLAIAGAAALTVAGAYLGDFYRTEAVAAREAARRETAVATALIEIGQELNATLNRAEVLRRLARRAAGLCGASVGAINLIDEASHYRVAEVSGVSEEERRAAREFYVDLTQLPGALALLDEPLVEVPDIGAQDRIPLETLSLFGFAGMLVAPMRRGAQLVGTVAFVYRRPRPPFTAHERMLARGLAEHAALALENARLYEEQQEAAETATALLTVAETLGKSLDPRQIENDLARLARDLLQSDGAAVYRPEGRCWRLAAAVAPELAERALEELRAVELDEATLPLFYQELRRAGTIEIQDRDVQQLVPPALMRRWHVRSSLTVLLARAGEPLATIGIMHENRTGPFTARERRILSGLAQLGVVALNNAHLAEQLRGANRVKSEFVAAMSHELRTPLNAILGYTDLLRDGTLGPVHSDQADALDRMRDRALDLLQMVQATLDLNRLEAGGVSVERSEVRIGDFIETVRAQVPARWLKPGVRLEFSVAEPQQSVWTDAAKLHAVVRNLIHNALKFTDHGEVNLEVRAADQRGQLVIEVRDTGCGIPAEKTADIFEMFVQGGNAPTHDGVGLGLYLCRRFVTLLGGSIEVTSRVGQGSTFRVRLPLPPPPPISAAGAGQ
ncbi:MAG: GAF domain-containing sensor histidine kinase [Deltaproteobacteria bacterium]|nr:GAF domain-containing sensor histidine kinase [Deltaproteobacteria bacterium]